MAKLTYLTICSLDGYIEDEKGKFDWAEPDPEVHAFVNDLERGVGTYLYGRRMYETMAVWETEPEHAAASDVTGDYAEIWQAAEKVVYSSSLQSVATSRTRLERSFDPEAVRQMKASSGSDLGIGGPALAASAFRAGLVDELNLLVVPVIVGSGKNALPRDVRLELALLDERRFETGVVHLRYAVGRPAPPAPSHH